MLEYLGFFALSAAVTGALTPLAIKIAPKIGAMDIPKDERRVHKKPIPRFGGIAIYFGIIAAFIAAGRFDQQMIGLVAGATLMLIVGIIDDIKGMPAKVKLCGQIACGVILYINTIQIRGIANFLPWGPSYIFFPKVIACFITVLWVVAVTNTINLIDGLDGLAAGISGIAFLSMAYTAAITNRPEIGLVMVGVAGAAASFLIWNFNPAKIFMGDAGSQLLGFMMASLSLIGDTPTKSTTFFAAITPVIVLALPIFDTTFAMLRRIYNHKPIMEADKGHLHHRVMNLGFGQKRTVLALYSISAIMGVAGILWTVHQRFECFVLMVIAATLIAVFLGIDPNNDSK